MSDLFDVTLVMHKRWVEVSFARSVRIDLLSEGELSEALSEGYQAVIHCAGMTNVEACEADPDSAFLANVVAAANVARAAKFAKAKFVNISTDHLFSGTKPMLGVQAIPAPQNTYARSKAAGEAAVLSVYPGALCVRTNFYCWGTQHRPSFSDYILKNLESGKSVDLFSDVFFTPIFAGHLIDAVHRKMSNIEGGAMHVVGSERISKLEFGKALADVFGQDQRLINPALLKERKELTKRPLDMSLISDTSEPSESSVLDGLNALRQERFSKKIVELSQL